MSVRTARSPRPAPPWKVWAGLWTIYVIWGSTYLAIRIMVRTVPPLLGAGLRFAVAGPLLLVVAAVSWATGSVASSRVDLPEDPLLSTGYQMAFAGLVMVTAGLVVGELSDVHWGGLSAESLGAFAYLIAIGSIVAYSAYTWLLQHAPVSKVSTYAYVNPVIAVFLGWIVLSEHIGPI